MRKKRDHSRRRKARNLLLAVLVLGAIWTIGLFRFADKVPKDVADGTTRTDAIVVLTGGSRRLDEGLKLLSRGLAGKLFVSGVYQGIDVRKLLQAVKRNPSDLETRISIGNATNTTGNAVETKEWMSSRNYRSLRLVTAAYHMPRSLLEFRFAMPSITLVPHPVFPDNVKQDRWWAWPGTASLMIGEYNKYLLAWARQGVGWLLMKTGSGEAV